MKANLNFNRRQWLAATFGFLATSIASPILAQTRIRRIRTQYIAALGAEGATSGTGAETWGLWKEDPGPIGVWLRLYQTLQKAGNLAPAGWRFDIDDWWLDENGLIMKAPEFPIPAGQYFVTNGEEHFSWCCQTNENSHRIACAALIYALNSWRHSVRAAVRLILKLSRE